MRLAQELYPENIEEVSAILDLLCRLTSFNEVITVRNFTWSYVSYPSHPFDSQWGKSDMLTPYNSCSRNTNNLWSGKEHCSS